MQDRHGADRLGRHRRHRLVDDALDEEDRLARNADRCTRGHLHLSKRDFGGAQPVDGGIAPSRQARRVGIDDEETDALAVAGGTLDARRHQQAVGGVAVQHQALLAVQHPIARFAPGLGGDMRQLIARLALAMRQRQGELAGGDLGDERRLLLVAAAMADEAAAHDHGREIGFERQRPAERLHDDHRLDRTAADPAIALLEGEPEQAQLGVARP